MFVTPDEQKKDTMRGNLYYTQKIRGFQQESVKYLGSIVRYSLKQTRFQYSRYSSNRVTIEPLSSRLVHGESMGCCRKMIFEFTPHRLIARRVKPERLNIFHFTPIRGCA